jgi:hypothetical protein
MEKGTQKRKKVVVRNSWIKFIKLKLIKHKPTLHIVAKSFYGLDQNNTFAIR